MRIATAEAALRCRERPQPCQPALSLDSPHQFARAGGSITSGAGGGFLDGLFHRFAAFAGTLLNPAIDFLELAFGELKIVIRKLGPLLFQLALGDVPVAFDFECVHSSSFRFLFPFAVTVTAEVLRRFGCWLTVRH